MRLHLVSLALLLLALCRTASSVPKFTIVSKNMQSTSSSLSIVPKEKRADIVKNVGVPAGTDIKPDAKAAEKLMDTMGNTMIAMGFMVAGVWAELPDSIMGAFAHGLFCDEKATDPNTVKEVMYSLAPGAEMTIEQKNKELTEAKKLKPSIDCGVAAPAEAPDTYECFCTHNKPLLYCVVVRLREEIAGLTLKKAGQAKLDEWKAMPCRDVALNALKGAGTGALGKTYDINSPAEKDAFKELFSGDAKGIDTISAEPGATNFFCDALNPKVEKAVVDLYASDGLYWLTEAVAMTIFFGPSDTGIQTLCQKDSVKATKYGKCFCEMKTGYSFCIYKVLAEYFEQEKYLDCGDKATGGSKQPAFDVAKKPAAVPASVLAKPEGGGGSGSAATSSLLLAPLTAAAAMLLRL